jgi:integrase
MRYPNGYGSVTKLPGKRRKPWAVRVTTRLEDGKQIRQYLGSYKTEREARRALDKHNERGIGMRQYITLSQLFEEWKTSKYDKLTKSTKDNYNAAWKHLSALGGEKVADIKKSQLQKLTDLLSNTMSYSSVHKVKTLASMLWDYAMADDIVDKNYAKLVELQSQAKQTKGILTDFEINQLIKLANRHDEQAMTVVMLVYTGMRIGELLELTRFNVDLNEMTVTGGMKTDAGKNRIIPIHPKVLPYFEHWLGKNTDMLITKSGKKMNTKYFRDRWWKDALERAGIDIGDRTPHVTRHTCATLLSRAGVDTLDIQRILGHANYSITADIYTRTDIQKLKESMSQIG